MTGCEACLKAGCACIDANSLISPLCGSYIGGVNYKPDLATLNSDLRTLNEEYPSFDERLIDTYIESGRMAVHGLT